MIPLAAFARFASSRGTVKVGIVREVKGGFADAMNFWRPFRKAIVAVHRDGRREALDELGVLPDSRKRRIYPAHVASYRRFLDATPATWFDPPKVTGGDVDQVELRPELGLVIAGARHAVHLHFDRLPVLADVHAEMLLEAMVPLRRADPDLLLAVLDVRAGRLVTARAPGTLAPLLAGELAAWREISAALP